VIYVAALAAWQLALAGALLGAIIGSFLGAVLVRLPAGRSVVTGRSACDSCGRTLLPADLVPIASYLLLRGRCRGCGARIDPWQFVCETGGAVLGGLPWLVIAEPVQAGAAMAFGWLLLLLALLDVRHFWLPARLVAALAAVGGAFVAARSWLAGGDPGPLVAATSGAALGFAILAIARIAYRRLRGREGMGGGDPLLLGAIGIWLGPLGVIETLLGASLAGIVVAVALLLTGRQVESDTALPLGTALAAVAWPLFVLQGFG
jgi:leader peptidase (prepilin peptidase)/N-methyltransferase